MTAPRTIAIDAFGGLAGDMWLGALVDLGAPLDAVRAALSGLGIAGWTMEGSQTTRRGIGCTRVRVDVPAEHVHRHLPQILAMIDRAALPGRARDRAHATFRALAEAEARVHRIPPEHVHFHEVGALDAILDVCGAAVALELLGIDEIWCGPLPAGSGVARCEHGEMPVPVPAVVELCAGRFSLVAGMGQGEMVTPTGAALLAALARALPPGAAWTPARVGYGAGFRGDSVVRMTVIEDLHLSGGAASRAGAFAGIAFERDEVTVLECWLDDMTPAHVGHLVDRLLELGAFDVAVAPVTMKKSRPAHALTVIVDHARADAVCARIFAESTTLGIRERSASRRVLRRATAQVDTPWGPVRVKTAGGRVRPEYDDLVRCARRAKWPLYAVEREVLRLSGGVQVADGRPGAPVQGHDRGHDRGPGRDHGHDHGHDHHHDHDHDHGHDHDHAGVPDHERGDSPAPGPTETHDHGHAHPHGAAHGHGHAHGETEEGDR